MGAFWDSSAGAGAGAGAGLGNFWKRWVRVRRDSVIKKLLKIFLFIFFYIFLLLKYFLKTHTMPWFTKKERRMQVSDFSAIFKADFGRFRRISAVFRPVSAVPAVLATSRYDPIWPIRLYFGQISSVRRRLKPIRHELSRIGTNRAESVRIREKKKKNADAVWHAGNHVGRRVPRRTWVRNLWCRVRAF